MQTLITFPPFIYSLLIIYYSFFFLLLLFLLLRVCVRTLLFRSYARQNVFRAECVPTRGIPPPCVYVYMLIGFMTCFIDSIRRARARFVKFILSLNRGRGIRVINDRRVFSVRRPPPGRRDPRDKSI